MGLWLLSGLTTFSNLFDFLVVLHDSEQLVGSELEKAARPKILAVGDASRTKKENSKTELDSSFSGH